MVTTQVWTLIYRRKKVSLGAKDMVHYSKFWDLWCTVFEDDPSQMLHLVPKEFEKDHLQMPQQHKSWHGQLVYNLVVQLQNQGPGNASKLKSKVESALDLHSRSSIGNLGTSFELKNHRDNSRPISSLVTSSSWLINWRTTQIRLAYHSLTYRGVFWSLCGFTQWEDLPNGSQMVRETSKSHEDKGDQG